MDILLRYGRPNGHYPRWAFYSNIQKNTIGGVGITVAISIALLFIAAKTFAQPSTEATSGEALISTPTNEKKLALIKNSPWEVVVSLDGVSPFANSQQATTATNATKTNLPLVTSLLVHLNESLRLNDSQKQLLRVGTVLPFTLKFSLSKPRWYAWDKELAQVTLPIRVGFNPLSGLYWMSRLQKTYVFNNLKALEEKSLRFDWWVLPILGLTKGEYQATLSVNMNRSLLPLLLQVDLRSSSHWQWQKNFEPRTVIIE